MASVEVCGPAEGSDSTVGSALARSVPTSEEAPGLRISSRSSPIGSVGDEDFDDDGGGGGSASTTSTSTNRLSPGRKSKEDRGPRRRRRRVKADLPPLHPPPHLTTGVWPSPTRPLPARLAFVLSHALCRCWGVARV